MDSTKKENKKQNKNTYLPKRRANPPAACQDYDDEQPKKDLANHVQNHPKENPMRTYSMDTEDERSRKWRKER